MRKAQRINPDDEGLVVTILAFLINEPYFPRLISTQQEFWNNFPVLQRYFLNHPTVKSTVSWRLFFKTLK